MKKILFSIATLTILNFSFGQTLDDFKWLEGTWQRQNVKEGNSAFESWEVNKDELIGIGATLRGADTVFVEKLKIKLIDGEMNYVALVGENGRPVNFKITSYDKKGFVSENPNHDFPKKITYKLEGKQLTATISGDGKEIPFLFEKIE